MKIAKKLTSVLLLVMCICMTFNVANAAGIEPTHNDVAELESVHRGGDITLDIDVFDTGFVLVPTGSIEGNVGTRSYPEKEVTKSFIHNLYDRNGAYIGTITTVIKGLYSQVDNWAQITSITATFGGPYASSLSYATYLSGNTGTVYIYFIGILSGSISYRILTNGTISQI